MLKVPYVVSTLKRSGPTNQLYNLVGHLDRRRFTPALATLSGEPADTRRADFEALGVPIRALGLSRTASFFRGRAKLTGVVREAAPDLIHTQGLRADWLAAQLARRFFEIYYKTAIDFDLDYIATYQALQA